MRQRTGPLVPGERCYLFPRQGSPGSHMRTLGASEVAELLREFGQRTAMRCGNPYRARAYARAAENLLTLMESLKTLLRSGFSAHTQVLRICFPGALAAAARWIGVMCDESPKRVVSTAASSVKPRPGNRHSQVSGL